MWNPNSDNKTEDVSIAETTNESQQQQQQQTLNIVDNKSQRQQNPSQTPSNIAGNGKITKTKNLEGESSSSSYGGGGGGGSYCASDNNNTNINYSSGGVDSGFLSGPQLTEDYDFDLKESSHTATAGTGAGIGGASISSSGKTIPTVQLNIIHPHKQTQQSTEDYQDSGIIDEDLVEVEEEHHQLHQQQQQQKPSITTTAATPQTQQRNIVATPTTAEQDQMILDSGVDAGVAEWFCKLTLKDSNQRLNNLGAANQNRFHVSSNQSKNAADSDPWEIYYQQNNEGDTQLHLACTGYVDVVAALIRMAPHPCLFNIQNDDAQTGLHLAVIYRQPKILRMLLIAGAEPTVRDANGNTALHLACYSGDIQCANALITPISASEIYEAHRSYGHLSSDKTTSCLDCAHLPADLEIRNYDGERCVHLAAQGGHIEILKNLVWFGADINAREGKSGRTPLHIAIETCNEVLANFLLEECSKLNLETETYAGLTAYQVACALNNSTMQNNLERRGAEPLTPPDSDYDSSDIETDLDDSQIYDRFGDPRFFVNYGGNPINVA